MIIPVPGGTWESPSAQPASGTYSVTASLDPGVLSLADLAAGHLASGIFVLDSGGPDVVDTITASVTLDSSDCATTTTTTAPPTTPSTLPTATDAPAPAPAPAPAVEVAPAFVG